MIMIKNVRKSGFTIIEVVLVLAIAGLIFLMVFIALPALQRGQRDTQRKNDVDRIMTAVMSYVSNNNKLPFGYEKNSLDTDFVIHYVDDSCVYKSMSSTASLQDYVYTKCSDQFTAPDGTIYHAAVIPGNTNYRSYDTKDHHRIYMQAGAKCGSAENMTIKTGRPKDFLVAIKLEGRSVYCVDNN